MQCLEMIVIALFCLFVITYRISSLVKDYCGVLTEEGIRLNLALVYELLDEVIVSCIFSGSVGDVPSLKDPFLNPPFVKVTPLFSYQDLPS